MKILIHGINYSPELVGAGKYTGELGAWLAAKGHEVRAVVAPPYYPEWRIAEGYFGCRYLREQILGVKVWRCPVWIPRKQNGIRRAFHLLSFAFGSLPVMLLQICWRPHLILVIEPTFAVVPQALLVARVTRAKAWLHVQDFEIEAAFTLGVVKGGLLKKILGVIESWFMRRFDWVTTISKSMLRGLAQKGISPEKSFLIPNWVDTDFIRPSEGTSSFRDLHGLSQDQKIVLYAGNLGEKQGLENLVEVARRLQNCKDLILRNPEGQVVEGGSLLFIICGAGTARTRLITLADRYGLSNLRFLPLQAAREFPGMLAAADIHLVLQRKGAADLVMPSKLSGIMAAGGTTIVTAEPGTELAQLVS